MAEFDLCVITARCDRLQRGHLEVARAALEGGARLIQLRDKALGGLALWELGQELRHLTRQYQATFVVNDRLDLALAVGADGVHLGEEDLPVAAARRLLGPQAIIGASAATAARARQAQAEGASYLGVGPIYSTPSKADAGEAIGLAGIAEIRRTVSLPVLAIGGITRDNVGAVIRAGADGVAVISAVSEAESMTEATAALLRAVREARAGTAAGANL